MLHAPLVAAQDDEIDDDELVEYGGDQESLVEDDPDLVDDEGVSEAEEVVYDADDDTGASSSSIHMARNHRPGAATYRLPADKVWSPLNWEGGRIFGQVELDVGFASYNHPDDTIRPVEKLNDMRGRFVLGPVFQRKLGEGDAFLAVVAQLVAWVREQNDEYQINVDDVYAQIGRGTKWDFQVGRFMTWRVYQKGLGFDIFTLEDQGASKSFPISNADFAVHTYEVDYMFLRNSPYVRGEVAGRAAFHYYPHETLGLELAGAYGLADNQSTNTAGVRLATDFQWKFLRVTAGAEYRRQDQTGTPVTTVDAGTPQERTVQCPKCGASRNYGFGGSVVVNFSPIRLGGAVAKGHDEVFLAVLGQRPVLDALGNQIGTEPAQPETSPAATGDRLSVGGFLELDAGSFLMNRSLILGAGMNRSEYILDNFNQEFHLQMAGYVAYPLGVNDAMVKLVGSQAKADLFDATDPQGTDFIKVSPDSFAVRFRFSSNF